MSRAALRLAVSNGIVRESPRPVAVDLPPRSRLRSALNLVLWLALVVVGLAAFTSLPE